MSINDNIHRVDGALCSMGLRNTPRWILIVIINEEYIHEDNLLTVSDDDSKLSNQEY